MRIGFNITDLIPGKIGGMESYMRTVIHHSPLLFPEDELYVFMNKSVWHTFLPGEQARIKPIFIKWVTREQLSEALKQSIIENSIDVWLSMLLILDPVDTYIPKAFTVPDMQHEYYPEFFTKEILAWRRKYYQQSADHADIIFTISNDSKKDLIKYLKADPDKVVVTYLDAPPWFNYTFNQDKMRKVQEKYKLPDRFIFYPANTWPHKNHIRLFQALKILTQKGLTVDLVLTGYSSDADIEVKKAISDLNLGKRINYLGYIDKNDMPYIYKNAVMLVFPSLFEGFGIPVLEAMKSECPVACSNSTSLPEVGGDAAVYFNPEDPADIANRIEQVLTISHLREDLVNKGLKQAEKFSFEKCCRETIDTLKSISHNLPDEPLISIVIPSYNQGEYIERTLQSILIQDYKNFEIIIMDGGSTDNTIEIMKEYATQHPQLITWESRQDKGQTHAINKGLKLARGEIMAYLNSDDTYEPGAFKKVVSFFLDNPHEYFVYGLGYHIDREDQYIEDYPNAPADREKLFQTCPICQPTAFWRRRLFNEVGFFSENLHYAMDYDYWIRASSKFRLNLINQHLANTRFYDTTKTSGQALEVHKEILNVVKRNYGKRSEPWVYAYAHIFLRDKLKLKRDTNLRNWLFRILQVMASAYKFIRFNGRLPLNAIRDFRGWFK